MDDLFLFVLSEIDTETEIVKLINHSKRVTIKYWLVHLITKVANLVQFLSLGVLFP